MDFYLLILFILFLTATADLIVGVSNDAVNFLNSAIGSKVASRTTIMIIASVGVILGTTFSSGIMEVARKGIFNPDFFTYHEVMIIFLAVMLTDIILLDLYNTFALPTSTTVSIVFEIFGGAVAIALLNVLGAGQPLYQVLEYVNTKNILVIISGIGLSIVFAFFCGLIIQFLTRLIFGFDYERIFRRIGSWYAGLALTGSTYFIMIKGAKGSTLLSPDFAQCLSANTMEFLLASFVGWTVFWQIILSFTKVNVLRAIVLIGTFSLALSFAANDLVNFVGAPLGALNVYQIGAAGIEFDPYTLKMGALAEPVTADIWILILAGIIMVITLWTSRKARSVTETEINLGRQGEGHERFDENGFAVGIVRIGQAFAGLLKKMAPQWLLRKIDEQIDPRKFERLTAGVDDPPAFDMLRAAVNLIVASSLISLGTSLKLPLSTTFVTFMVAMATSLADKAWGKESAVNRVTGVLTVIGGWFLTALMAFITCFLFTMLIYFGELPAILFLVAFGMFFYYRTMRLHRERSMVPKG